MTSSTEVVNPPVAPLALYPHTLTTVPTLQSLQAPPPQKVDVDAIAVLYDRSQSTVLYLDRALSDTDTLALFDKHQLVATFDAVRGVDAVQQA